MRVFLDANILFSASKKGSATRRLLLALSSHAEILTNEHAVEEARRNLALKRPSQLPELPEVLDLIELTKAYARGHLADVPDEDVPIVASAVGAACTHLWTSDKRHFGALCGTSIRGVKIVSSVMLAEELLARGRRL